MGSPWASPLESHLTRTVQGLGCELLSEFVGKQNRGRILTKREPAFYNGCCRGTGFKEAGALPQRRPLPEDLAGFDSIRCNVPTHNSFQEGSFDDIRVARSAVRV